jgi:transposase InsO family protein
LPASGFSRATFYNWRSRFFGIELSDAAKHRELEAENKKLKRLWDESFVKTLKRDYSKLINRPDSKIVLAYLKDWFDNYNSYHPHSALGYLPPTLFREKRSVT